MQPKTVQKPQDALTANNWIFKVIDPETGERTVSPNFSRLEGLSRQTETITRMDGGAGLEYTFHGGVTRYEDGTLVRINDQTEDDEVMKNLVDEFAESGKKFDGTMLKYHHGVIAVKINVLGLSFHTEEHPSYDNTSANPMEMSYPFSVDYWEPDFTAGS